jgi:hypothetical protein
VTPLGSREGLIEWVENSKPLFQIVNNWQQFATERATALTAEQGKPLFIQPCQVWGRATWYL